MKSQIFLFLLLLPLLALAAPMGAASAPEFDAVDACLAAQVRADRTPGLATPHRWWFGLPFPVNAPYLADALPAGFLISNAEDMIPITILKAMFCTQIVITQPCHCEPFFGEAISEFIRLNEPLGDCFVAKNAPRNDIPNGFEAGLNSYRKYIWARQTWSLKTCLV
jgi:hypothetical protein